MDRQWILAPGETKEALLERKRLLNQKSLSKKTGLKLPLYDLYDLEVFVIYGKKSLQPWQGAVLWEYREENGCKYPVIQLKEENPQEEVLSHELVHAARFRFKEPFFEEMFAYQTSSSPWKRFLGPIFLRPAEATCFALICLAAPFVSVFLGSFAGGKLLLGAVIFLMGRLICLKAIFVWCRKKLEKAGILADSCLPVMIRLSDREILQTALRSAQKTRASFEKRAQVEDRFQVIVESYFNPAQSSAIYN